MTNIKKSLPVCAASPGFNSVESINQHVRSETQGAVNPIPLIILVALAFGFGISMYGTKTVSPAEIKELAQDSCMQQQLATVGSQKLITVKNPMAKARALFEV